LQRRDLSSPGLDQNQQFFRRSQNYVGFGVPVDCLQVKVTAFNLFTRDHPTAIGVPARGEQVEEIVEPIYGANPLEVLGVMDPKIVQKTKEVIEL
jgi:hypothetical protein